jgi:RNA polymerase sigma factor (sigma-70 family)
MQGRRSKGTRASWVLRQQADAAGPRILEAEERGATLAFGPLQCCWRRQFIARLQYLLCSSVYVVMQSPHAPTPATDRDSDLAATVVRERPRLGNFIRRRVRDPMEAEDLLQDVLEELVEAYRLPEPLEQVSAWLYRVARNRIIDRFRRNKRRSTDEPGAVDESDGEYRLNLELPGLDQGPEALYARSIVLEALQRALDELPAEQRDVFVQHELEGLSFKHMAQLSGVALNTLLARKRSAVLHLRSRLQAVYDDLEP